jgi:hypothetical protein
MKRRALLLSLPLAALPLELWAEPKAKLPPWEKFDEEDGIAVFRREIPGSPIVALRGEGLVAAPILRVGSVLVDSARAPEWIDSLEEVKILRTISDTERIEWNHFSTPFVLADRDFVFKSKLEIKPASKQVLMTSISVQDPAAPKTDYVRGHLQYAIFALTSVNGGKATRVLAEAQCDPKGSVAKWIVNLFQKGWPHNTLTALREQVSKKNVSDDPKLKKAMADAGFVP